MSTQSQDLTRDPDLWLEDGNVVIIAQDAAFRVHRGLLSRHSDVFSGLFALAQPDDQDHVELCDECPVVRIPDSPHDFRHLLHVLYDGSRYTESAEERTKFSMYAALARLGDKYEFPHIFAAAIKWLSTIFAETYPVWHALWDKHRSMSNLMSDRGVNPFEAANLFRITRQERMRPTALFMCSQLDVRVLLGGRPRADGVVEVLSTEDLQRCLEARIRFTAVMTAFMYKFYVVHTTTPAVNCSSPTRCPDAFTEDRDAHRSFSFGEKPPYFQNPFKISNWMCRRIETKPSDLLCPHCASPLLVQARDLARSHWNALPKSMGLHDCIRDWETVLAS